VVGNFIPESYSLSSFTIGIFPDRSEGALHVDEIQRIGLDPKVSNYDGPSVSVI
jgi:hypothetical protein